MPNFGITGSGTGSSSVNYWRSMCGVSPDVDGMTLDSISIYVAASHGQQVRVGLHAGGSVTNPSGATIIGEGLTTGSGTNEWITVPISGSPSIPKNTPLWVSIAGQTSGGTFSVGYYQASQSGGYETARGRCAVDTSAQDPNDPYDSPMPSSTSFGDYWYCIYLTYTEGTVPYITNMEGEFFTPTETDVDIDGGNFLASQGVNGKVELGDADTYGASSLALQSINAWANGLINIDISLGGLSEGPLWVYITNNNSEVSVGYPITVSSSIINNYPFDDIVSAEVDWDFVGPAGNDLQAENTGGQWCWHDEDTTSSGVGPLSGQGGDPDGYVYTEGSTNTAVDDEFTMTMTDAINASLFAVTGSFYRSMDFDGDAGELHVECWDGDSWEQEYFWNSPNTDPAWVQQVFDFSSYTNTDFKIRFRTVVKGTEWHNDCGIDTVQIIQTLKEINVPHTASELHLNPGNHSVVIDTVVLHTASELSLTPGNHLVSTKPIISFIDPYTEWFPLHYDDVTLNGLVFGSVEGKVELGNNTDYGSCTLLVEQEVISWTDDTIHINLDIGAHNQNGLFLFVIHDNNDISNSINISLSNKHILDWNFDAIDSPMNEYLYFWGANTIQYDLAAVGSEGKWCWYNEDTPTSNTGPLSGQEGDPDGYIYTESDGAELGEFFDLQPYYSFLANKFFIDISFYRSMDCDNQTDSILNIDGWDGVDWTTEYTWNATTDPAWVLTEADLSSFVNDDFYLSLWTWLAGTGTANLNDIGIDSITLTLSARVLDIRHFISELHLNPGNHSVIVDTVIQHTTSQLHLNPGNHSVIIDTIVPHNISQLHLNSGNHQATVDQFIYHTASNLQLNPGSHLPVVDTIISHTASQLRLNPGSHIPIVDTVINHSISQLNLNPGIHIVTTGVNVFHTTNQLQLNPGSHQVTVDAIIAHTTNQLQLNSGNHIPIIDTVIQHNISQLNLNPGSHKAIVDAVITHSINQLELTPGNHQAIVDVVVIHATSQLNFNPGNHEATVDAIIAHTTSQLNLNPGNHLPVVDTVINHSISQLNLNPGNHILEVDAIIIHTSSELQLNPGSHEATVDAIIAHTTNQLQLNPGSHQVTVDAIIAHTTNQLQLNPGSHEATVDQFIYHTASNLQLNPGSHTASSGVVVQHNISQLHLNSGNHQATVDQFIYHTASNLQLNPGSHLPVVDTIISHTASQLRLNPGSHIPIVDTVINHSISQLNLNSGIHTLEVDAVISHNISELRLNPGNHIPIVDNIILHTASQLHLNPGVHQATVDAIIIHSISGLQLNPGNHILEVDAIIIHTSSELQLNPGSHEATVDAIIAHTTNQLQLNPGSHQVTVDAIIAHTTNQLQLNPGSHEATVDTVIIHSISELHLNPGSHEASAGINIFHTTNQLQLNPGNHEATVDAIIAHTTNQLHLNSGNHIPIIDTVIQHSISQLNMNPGGHTVLVDSVIIHSVSELHLNPGNHIVSTSTEVLHTTSVLHLNPGNHTPIIDVNIIHTTHNLRFNTGVHLLRYPNDTIVSQISWNLRNVLTGLNTFEGSATVEFERVHLEINDRYPFVEVSGPYVGVQQQTYQVDDVMLEYTIKYFTNKGDANKDVGGELPWLTRNVADEIQKLIMRDPQRLELAMNTEVVDKGHAFEEISDISEFYVYVVLQIHVLLNAKDPYKIG